MSRQWESRPMEAPKTLTQAGPKRTSVAFGAIAAATVGASVASVFGVRINTSYSLPMGLYMRTSDPRASLIEFCPEGRYAVESSERGYRTGGFFSDGAPPPLKPGVPQPADKLQMCPGGIPQKHATPAPATPRAKYT